MSTMSLLVSLRGLAWERVLKGERDEETEWKQCIGRITINKQGERVRFSGEQAARREHFLVELLATLSLPSRETS